MLGNRDHRPDIEPGREVLHAHHHVVAARRERGGVLREHPLAVGDALTYEPEEPIDYVVAKARDTRNTTSAIVTHRYQDGHIMANFRFNPSTGELERAPRDSNIHDRTRFMVFRDDAECAAADLQFMFRAGRQRTF